MTFTHINLTPGARSLAAAGHRLHTREEAPSVETLTRSVEQFGARAAERIEGVEQTVRGMQAEFNELLQRQDAGGRGQSHASTWGQLVTRSQEFAAFRSSGLRGTQRIEVRAITSVGTDGAYVGRIEQDPSWIPMARRQITLRDLLNPRPTESGLIQAVRQTGRVNNAAPVAETAQKPESSYSFELVDAPARTIAHWVPVSRQVMDDAPQLEAVIDGELVYGLRLVEEAQIIAGDGTGQNLHGLIPNSSAYVAPFAVADGTMIDTLRLALLQAQLAGYPATGIVVNPIDLARMELLKDADGRYLLQQVNGQPMLWNRPVVESEAMAADKFLVGAFGLAAQLFDRMEPEVLVSSEDRDNFIKNMLTVRAEERVALVIRRPEAIVYGDFGNVP